MKYSIIIPIYKNEAFIEALLAILNRLNQVFDKQIEAVFVVDGSPDRSFELLNIHLASQGFAAQLLSHSRNFGSFAAIRSGLSVARGEYFAVMAADLQEPPELIIDFFKALESNECEVAIGTRKSREDPWFSRLTAFIFWSLYKRLVVKEMPPGGVDIFACNRQFRSHLLQFEESRSSLIALIFWLGFRRKLISYERLPRKNGKSAWTFRKKIDYMLDSIFAFTDYPIRVLTAVGALGSLVASIIGLFILMAKLAHIISVPGYAATILCVLMLGALNLFGLGLVGTYAWRGYENSKNRPIAVIARHITKEISNE